MGSLRSTSVGGLLLISLGTFVGACATDSAVPTRPSTIAKDPVLEVGIPNGRTMTLSSAAEPEFRRMVALAANGEERRLERAEHLVRWVHKHIRERSGGFLQYTNLRTFVLPQTGIAWQFGIKRNYYQDPLEGIGLPVDIYLDRIDAPIEKIVTLVRSLRG